METIVHQIKETHCNKDENCIVGESSIDIKDSIIDTMADLYTYGLKEYGRCVSKVYIDCKDGSTKHIGYVFEKKTKYSDCNETYIAETWLTIEHYKETITRVNL